MKEQIAADLRARIEAGEWGPRRRLPTVVHLSQHYGVAKDTVQLALGLLRELGIVYTVRNRGTFVRSGSDLVAIVVVEPGMRVIYRPASETERRDMELPDGAAVAVVERLGRSLSEVEVIPADKVEIRGPE